MNMHRIQVATSNNIVWNRDEFISDVLYFMLQGEAICIDLINEGPCCNTGIYKILEDIASRCNYDLKNITILTCNSLETHNTINVKYHAPIHLIINGNEKITSQFYKNAEDMHLFGMFIVRSNGPRLRLATYLNYKLKNNSILSYRYNKNDDFVRNNIGLEELVNNYGISNVSAESEFLSLCPLLIENMKEIVYRNNDEHNYIQQLLEYDSNTIDQYYKDFFVEMVCETYYSGETFFPTEKIWRPILLKTPFIVQGPQWYLKNLRRLGFKTFSKWWDEGYDEDSEYGKLNSIINNIDWISQQSRNTIVEWYSEMQPILDHNYDTLLNLTKKDFENINEKYYE